VLISIAAGLVSIRHRFKGPNHAVATACAAGAHAVGDAYNWIRLGYADIMLAGGAEACICPLTIAGFARMKALSTCSDPTKASRPFDERRDGFVIGEGAAILVLEELNSAIKRNAPIIAELCGYGVSGDAHHITSPALDGDGASRAMLSALRDAGLQPQDIGYVNAHATSTPIGDAVETAAIEKVFRANQESLLVSSTKGATGHMLGAAGAIEACFAALAVRDSIVPPTLNLDIDNLKNKPSFSHVPLVSVSAPSLIHSMSNSFGFGGTNASLIFKKYVT